jgi:hypothetical protein
MNAFIFRMLPCTTNCATVQATTISNLIIHNEEYHWQDFNQDNFLSGAIFIESTCKYMGLACLNNCSANNNPASCSDCPDCIGRNFLIDNCEIFGFNYAGVHCNAMTDNFTISNSYIHNIKGIRSTVDNPGGSIAIAYGVWVQTAKYQTNVDFLNTIFDDCKAAIDGQNGAADWNIEDCTFSQFFVGSINKHAGNDGMIADPKPQSSSSPCNSSTCLFYEREPPGINACSPFEVKDLAGGNPTLERNIFHKPLDGSGLGGCANFPYPFNYTVFKITYSSTPAVPLTFYSLCDDGIENHSNGETFILGSTLNNGIWTNVPIGFDFDFMGIEYNEVNVSTNGFIQFGTGLTLSANEVAHELPNFNLPNNYISFCATDLDFSASNTFIRYGTGATTLGQNYFVIEFTGTHPCNTTFVSGRIVLYDKIISGSSILETGKIGVYLDNTLASFGCLSNTKPVLGVENFTGLGGMVATGRNGDNSWGGSGLEAWEFLPRNFKITFRNNTCAPPGTLPSNVNYNLGGYLKVADNFIGACAWEGNPNFDVASIPLNYIFEQNSHDINDMILKHDGIISAENILSSDSALAESIASQCPYKGGKAVYSARVIVWKFRPDALFLDEDLCNDGSYFRGPQHSPAAAKIIVPITLIPNPANNNVIIYYLLNEYETARAYLIDITGRHIKSVSLNTKETKADFDVKEISQGIYALKVFADKNLIGTLQLSVIK